MKKTILITILIIVILFGGAYLGGNYMMGTLKGDVIEQVLGLLAGAVIWCILGLSVCIVMGIYKAVSSSRK